MIPISNITQTPLSLTSRSRLNRPPQRGHLLKQATSRRRWVRSIRVPTRFTLNQSIKSRPLLTRIPPIPGSNITHLITNRASTTIRIRITTETEDARHPINNVGKRLRCHTDTGFNERAAIRETVSDPTLGALPDRTERGQRVKPA